VRADELRELQAPLKDRYREDPDAAVVTLRATGTLGEGVTCSVQTGRALAVAGLHPAATALAIPVEGEVTAEGDLDFRGTLGVARDAPVGFRSIRLRFDLVTDAEAERVAKLVELTERYCVVLQTIAGSPALSVEWAGR
jgi:hypothetical protein